MQPPCIIKYKRIHKTFAAFRSSVGKQRPIVFGALETIAFVGCYVNL